MDSAYTQEMPVYIPEVRFPKSLGRVPYRVPNSLGSKPKASTFLTLTLWKSLCKGFNKKLKSPGTTTEGT